MERREAKVFVIALAFVSILGFIGILSESLFETNINVYVESIMILIIGIALIFEVSFKRISTISDSGLNQSNFSAVTLLTIAIIAIITGILNFPQIGVSFQGFLAIKGILSILAIVIIVIQTWVIEK